MTDYSFTKLPLEMWTEWARRDDWHQRFVGSDIRQMIGEIQRIDRDAFTWKLTSRTMAAGSDMDAHERAKRVQSTRDAEAAIIEWCARIAAHHSPEAGKAILAAGRV